MTTPGSPGWYDDPEATNAERFFDGERWTPQRRRKQLASRQHAQPSTPYSHNPPAGPLGPSVAPPPTNPFTPDGHLAVTSPYDPYAPPPPTFAYPHLPTNHPELPLTARLRAGMASGTDRIIGLLTASFGIALIAASVTVWARVRAAGSYKGAMISVTASFPGLGSPKITATYSEDATRGNLEITDPSLALHNTNPGWVALVLGIIALLASAAYLWLPHRKTIGAVLAVLAGTVSVICTSHLLDLRGTFGDPPDLADIDFSPGGGLIATSALSLALTALGIAAYVVNAKRPQTPYSAAA